MTGLGFGGTQEPVLASVVVLLGLGLETLPLYSMAVQMGQKFKDQKDVEGIVAHFRSLPRPDMSEVRMLSRILCGLPLSPLPCFNCEP